MKFKLPFCFIIITVLLGACSKDPVLTDRVLPVTDMLNSELPEEYEAGWVRVKFRYLDHDLSVIAKGDRDFYTGIKELDNLAAELGVRQAHRVFAEGGKFRERREKYGLHLWYDFYVGEDVPITGPINSFRELSIVDVAEAIPVFRQTSPPVSMISKALAGFNLQPSSLFSPVREKKNGAPFNDPLLYRQWHYNNDGSTASSVAGADARIFSAWVTSTGHPDVIVAIVDGGIDFSHPDLAQNMWINRGEIPGNGKDDDGNGYIDDIYGYRWSKSGLPPAGGDIKPMDHGSHCAGVVAAVNNNGVGIAGIAGGNGSSFTGARLMSCQTYVPDPAYPGDPYGNSKSTSQTPDAFAYAADNGAVIVNCSFTYSGSSLSAAYKAGIDYFVDNAGTDENGVQTGPMKGGLMVAAAGNDGQVLAQYPASYIKVISVAYSMSNYKKSPSSNYGPSIDVTAPGGATSSSYAPGKAGGIFSTIPMESNNYDVQKGYAYKSGTSMAAPHVAGVAALILSAAVEKDIPMTAGKLRSIIERSCFSLDPWNPEYTGMLGHGQIDAGHAIQLLLAGDDQTVSQPQNVATVPEKYAINVSWETPSDFVGNPVVAIETFISLNPLEGVNYDRPPKGVKKEILENTANVGVKVEKKFQNLESNTEYFLALIAVDRYNQKSEPVVFSATTKPELEPDKSTGKQFVVAPTVVKEEFTIGFSESVYGQNIRVEIFNSVGYKMFTSDITGGSRPVTVNIKQLAGGVYTVALKTQNIVEKHTIIKY